MQVKLIIAKTYEDTVYFNYGDDYSDVTRVLVEDHSPWEEVESESMDDLREFVRDYNNQNKRKQTFAFLIEKDDQITAREAIATILKKRKEALRKAREEEAKRKEEAERKKREREIKKLAKTKEQKLKLLQQLKEELGE